QAGRVGHAGLPGGGGTGHHAEREARHRSGSRRGRSGHRRLHGVPALLLVVPAVLLLGVVLVVLAVLLLALVLVAVPLAVALAALVRRTGRGCKTRARDGKDEQSCNQRSEVTRETHLGVLPLWRAPFRVTRLRRRVKTACGGGTIGLTRAIVRPARGLRGDSRHTRRVFEGASVWSQGRLTPRLRPTSRPGRPRPRPPRRGRKVARAGACGRRPAMRARAGALALAGALPRSRVRAAGRCSQ